MLSVNFTFVVHSPYVLNRGYNYFSIGNNKSSYFDMEATEKNIHSISDSCYIPANNILLDTISKYKSCKVSFSISNTIINQLERFRPDVITSFQELFATKQVEMLAGTGFNSLAFNYSSNEKFNEFKRQVEFTQQRVQELFRVKPQVFLNTEMIYSNHISDLLNSLSFNAMLTEGAEHILGWRSQNFVYQPKKIFKQRLLFRNNFLSNAIAFNFSNTHWHEYPLTAEKFVQWIKDLDKNAKVVNIVLDYETFGFFQPAESGILQFLSRVLELLSEQSKIKLNTPSKTVEKYDPVAKIDVLYYISWTGTEQDISPWIGNELQRSALDACYALEEKIVANNQSDLIDQWCLLQSADYFHFMDTRWANVGYIPHNLNNFASAEEAYIVYTNIINDMALKL